MARDSLAPRGFERLVVASMLATTLACSGDQGLIVQVTRDSVTPAAVDSLTFVVATHQTDGTGTAWVLDPTSSVTVTLAAQDLLAEPYRLFLHNGTELGSDAELIVAVFASAAGQEVAFGAFSVPQRFIPGKVLVREITLQGYVDDTRPYATDSVGCLGWVPDQSAPDQWVKVGTSTDKDCDGDPATVDCNDFDPRQGTNQYEACDGFASSCGTKDPAGERCYGRFPDTCDFGLAPCTDDSVPGGVIGECQWDESEPSTSVPEEFCIAYDECITEASTDPFGCATVRAAMTIQCSLIYDANGALCDRGPAVLPVPTGAASCFWALVNGQTQAHYKVGLSSSISLVPSVEIQECDVRLSVLEKFDPIPQPTTIWLAWTADGVGQPVRVDIAPVQENICPAAELALHCSVATQQ